MDLLYSRYASPMNLVNLYLEQGRFGEFVENIIELENERKRAEADKEHEHKLWSMFIHSMSEKPFNEWKSEVLKQSEQKGKPRTKDEDMTEQDIQNIMDRLFP